MNWVVAWVLLSATMAGALVYIHAGPITLLLCFLAWCGGVVSVLAAQKVRARVA